MSGPKRTTEAAAGAALGLDRKVLTTGQIARACGVAARTVTKWFDAGRFPGGFRIPGSRDRRVPREGVLAFLAAHGMPVPDSLGPPVAMLVGCSGLADQLAPLLGPGWGVEAAEGAFDAAGVCARTSGRLKVAVLDAQGQGRPEALNLARHLAQLEPAPRVILLAPEDGGLTLEGAGEGVAAVVQHPVDPLALAALMAPTEDEG